MIKISLEDERNLSMLVDFYEFTMANGYFENNLKDKTVYFDMFFRKNPDNAITPIIVTASSKEVEFRVEVLKRVVE